MATNTRPLYQVLAQLVDAYHRCVKRTSLEGGPDFVAAEWVKKHREKIGELVKLHFPSGCGIDAGNSLDLAESTGEKLVIQTEYHHMDENGFYEVWTKHTITVKPSMLTGISMSISGKNYREIKEYLYEVFDCALHEPISTEV